MTNSMLFPVKMNSVRYFSKSIYHHQCFKPKFHFIRVLSSHPPNKTPDSSKNYRQKRFYDYGKMIGGTSLILFLLYEINDRRRKWNVVTKQAEVGDYRDDLPKYSMEEVAQHASKDTGIWVTYKEGVYDITEFVPKHPGGDLILIGAGGALEPFWMLYAAHVRPEVFELLETYRIGNLSKEGSQDVTANQSDPYIHDPKRHQYLIPASKKPFNAEVPVSVLIEHFITPNEFFYVRNHVPVPEVDLNTYELEVEIEGRKATKTFSLEDLKKFPKHTITATIMCAGNRRSEMVEVKPVKGLKWGPSAVGTAIFTGVRLRDVLYSLGLTDDEKELKHVQFEGLDFDPTGTSYGASIPLWKAIDKRGDVLLAWEMNGEHLPRDHGFPLRVVVPGVAGARNVKWLGKCAPLSDRFRTISSQLEALPNNARIPNFSLIERRLRLKFWRITDAFTEITPEIVSIVLLVLETDISGKIIVSASESTSHWQQNDYKGFSPSVDWDTVDFTKAPAIQELPVISAIGKPSPNEIVKVVDGHILVKGYAWSGGGQKIIRVDVTIDNGETWHCADFDHQDDAEPPQHWSWTLWSVRVPIKDKIEKAEIWAKAVDSSYNVQPESFKNVWNLRGVLSNAYHRVPIRLAY